MREKKWENAFVLQGRNTEYSRQWEDLEMEFTHKDILHDAKETRALYEGTGYEFRIIHRRVPARKWE